MIGMYPRLAKASLIGLCVVCVFALLTFVVGRALGDEHAQYVSRAFLLFVLLVFPIIGAANYFYDPIDREIKNVNFQDDPNLKELLRLTCSPI